MYTCKSHVHLYRIMAHNKKKKQMNKVFLGERAMELFMHKNYSMYTPLSVYIESFVYHFKFGEPYTNNKI